MSIFPDLKVNPQDIIRDPIYRLALNQDPPPLTDEERENFRCRADVALRMIATGKDPEYDPTNVWRASALGKCFRCLVFKMFGAQPTNPTDARGLINMAAGWTWEAKVSTWARVALRIERPDWTFLKVEPLKVVTSGGVTVTGTCDDLLQTHAGIIKVEYKTMSSFMFDRAERDNTIDNMWGYLDQDAVYRRGYARVLGKPGCLDGLFVNIRKNSGNISEIRIPHRPQEDANQLKGLMRKADQLYLMFQEHRPKTIGALRKLVEYHPRFDPTWSKRPEGWKLDPRCKLCDYLDLCIPITHRIAKVVNKNKVWIVADHAYGKAGGWAV